MLKILFLGDIVGKVGRRVIKTKIPELKVRYDPDLIIANGENSAGGIGIESRTAKEIFDAGVDLITSGNHIWSKREFHSYLESHSKLVIRPINFTKGVPGQGWTVWESPKKVKCAVINAIGRVFMPDLVDCPFQALEQILCGSEPEFAELRECKIKFLDFHAEATSEKVAMGYFLDGKVSVMVGTHTHVQTADERIFKQGLAYITDVGMCGPADSVIGVKSELVVQRFRTGLPVRFDVAKGDALLNGVIVSIDETSGTALKIERINEVVPA